MRRIGADQETRVVPFCFDARRGQLFRDHPRRDDLTKTKDPVESLRRQLAYQANPLTDIFELLSSGLDKFDETRRCKNKKKVTNGREMFLDDAAD